MFLLLFLYCVDANKAMQNIPQNVSGLSDLSTTKKVIKKF